MPSQVPDDYVRRLQSSHQNAILSYRTTPTIRASRRRSFPLFAMIAFGSRLTRGRGRCGSRSSCTSVIRSRCWYGVVVMIAMKLVPQRTHHGRYGSLMVVIAIGKTTLKVKISIRYGQVRADAAASVRSRYASPSTRHVGSGTLMLQQEATTCRATTNCGRIPNDGIRRR